MSCSPAYSFPVCVFMSLYNHCFVVFIAIMYVILICLFLNTCNFRQRTEQVLIELDISTIEDYVIIIKNDVTEI